MTKTIPVPSKQHGAYQVPDPGDDLQLDLVADAGVEILTSEVQCQDGEDYLLWQRTLATPAKHTYNLGMVLSSREWVWIKGTYRKAGAGGGTAGQPPEFNAMVPGVDLDVEGVDEADEESTGALVCVSNAMKTITLYKVQPQERYPSAAVKLEGGGGRVKVWTNANKTGWVPLPQTFAANGLPKTLWIEGISPSASVRDTELKASYTCPDNGGITEDKIKLTILKVEMTKPKWTPEFPGDYSDVSYTFDTASQGVCTIDAEGTCGVFSLNPNLEWDIEATSGSTRSSVPNPAKGASVTFKYSGLPSSNAELGCKLLSLVYPGYAAIGQDVLIFFSKMASNNPGGSSPNWFYYWSQTSASYGTHTYNSHTNDLGHCDWVSGAWCAFICKTSENYDINRFATTCRHEAQHVTDLSSWWPLGYPTANDSDNDLVPDTLELGLGYNPALRDTDGDGYRDCEDHAYDNQPSWTYGSARSEDWANPGSQFTSP